MSFLCRLATGADLAGYFALRREIFCDEQGLFAGSDHDAIDDHALGIVCVDTDFIAGERVVGVVRIWEETPGRWWGGRLGVQRDFRIVGSIGRKLIETAVGTARAWGAVDFRATVQRANVPLFRRLHWQTLGELEILGAPHHLMEATLARYAPLAQERPVRRAAA